MLPLTPSPPAITTEPTVLEVDSMFAVYLVTPVTVPPANGNLPSMAAVMFCLVSAISTHVLFVASVNWNNFPESVRKQSIPTCKLVVGYAVPEKHDIMDLSLLRSSGRDAARIVLDGISV